MTTATPKTKGHHCITCGSWFKQNGEELHCPHCDEAWLNWQEWRRKNDRLGWIYNVLGGAVLVLLIFLAAGGCK